MLNWDECFFKATSLRLSTTIFSKYIHLLIQSSLSLKLCFALPDQQ